MIAVCQSPTRGAGTWVVCGKSKAESREPGSSVLCILILLFSLSHVLYSPVTLPRSPFLTSYSVIVAFVAALAVVAVVVVVIIVVIITIVAIVAIGAEVVVAIMAFVVVLL